jgi:hypothetical protein
MFNDVVQVQLSTINFAWEGSLPLDPSQAWVFPKCGHVHGFNPGLIEQRRCTICRETGDYTPLKLEPDEILKIFCKDRPTHVFNPCGHAADEQAVQKWSQILQPLLLDPIYQEPSCSCCPFCRTVLSKTHPYSKLIYQSNDDETTVF